MAFTIHIKEEIGNQISERLGNNYKTVTSSSLTITDGFLIKGNFRIPIEHILFIEEV
jgi:hypothetical protein